MSRVVWAVVCLVSQKAPSAKRCIKTPNLGYIVQSVIPSESTERQKVH